MARIYRFYVDIYKRDELNKEDMSDLTIERKFPLYAWTDSKKLAKSFREFRNMEMFVERTSTLEKDEVVIYGNKNRTTELSMEIFLTEVDTDWENIKIAVTWHEKEFVNDAIDMGFQNELCLRTDYTLFKNKYIRALDKIAYVAYYELENGTNDDYEVPEIMFDELAVLITEAGETFRNNE